VDEDKIQKENCLMGLIVRIKMNNRMMAMELEFHYPEMMV
jgi:hypothetical protein